MWKCIFIPILAKKKTTYIHRMTLAFSWRFLRFSACFSHDMLRIHDIVVSLLLAAMFFARIPWPTDNVCIEYYIHGIIRRWLCCRCCRLLLVVGFWCLVRLAGDTVAYTQHNPTNRCTIPAHTRIVYTSHIYIYLIQDYEHATIYMLFMLCILSCVFNTCSKWGRLRFTWIVQNVQSCCCAGFVVVACVHACTYVIKRMCVLLSSVLQT